ncbi:MFS sugar transporter [Ascosphaera atra]|nr:MFS sugar transporter [Ascosphaera atra]
MPWGSLAGSMMSSCLADRFSRVYSLRISAVFWIIGSILMMLSNGLPMLIVGRLIAGLGIGVASTIVPVYQAEVAPKEVRGRLISLQQWSVTWGILIQYFIQYGCSHMSGGATNPNQGTVAFRLPWGIQIVPAAIFLAGLFFFPKSPRWLASKDRWEDALEVLARLHAGGDKTDPIVLAEYNEIEDAIKEEQRNSQTPVRELFKPRIAKRVFLGMSLQMWSQLSGMNVMMYYIVYIMQATKTGSPLLTASIQYILNVVMTLPAVLFLDRMGRRTAMLWGFAFMGVWLYIVGALQAVYGHPNPHTDPTLEAISWVVTDKRAGQAIIACSYLFVCSFAPTIGPVSWTYPAEIFPANVRAMAVSLATGCNWTWNALLGLFVPPLLKSIDWKTYMMFGSFNAAAFVHMFLTAHETKKLTLEEMDVIFDSGKWPWQTLERNSRLDNMVSDFANGREPAGGFDVVVAADEDEEKGETVDMVTTVSSSETVIRHTVQLQWHCPPHGCPPFVP